MSHPTVRTEPTVSRSVPPRRTAPFEREPGFYEPAKLWLYGNARLLGGNLRCVPDAPLNADDGDAVEACAERIVLAGETLVAGIHTEAHRRSAIVPLRWGAPRVLVLLGGIRHHLGPDLKEEPFPEARLWRYEFDPKADLVVSRRSPNQAPARAHGAEASLDRLIRGIANREIDALLFQPHMQV